MVDPLGANSDVNAEPEDTRVVGMDDEEAGDVLSVLSADTAREILGELYAEPGPASELADRTDTTIQNVQYHLENLTEAGLIEVADTTYSPKGREMNVYVPSDRAVVVVPSGDSDRDRLPEFLAALVPLGLLAAAAEFLFDGPFAPDRLPFVAQTGGADGTEQVQAAAETTAGAAAAEPTLLAQLTASPGVAVLVGGLIALAAVGLVTVLRGR